MAGNTGGRDRIGSAREEFAQKLTQLWEAAGRPTLAQVERDAAKLAEVGVDRPFRRLIGVWKSGENLPHTFETVLPVISTLITIGRKQSGTVPPELADTTVWRKRWERADAEKRADTTPAKAAKTRAEKTSARKNPYRGLLSYRREDTEFFYGRDTAVTAVIDRLVEHRDGPAIVVVSGVSGAGKSSLLHAGVLPRIRAAGLPGTTGARAWPQITLTPGPKPLENLATSSAAALGRSAAELRRELDDFPADFALTVAAAAAGVPAAADDDAAEGRVLIVVDQFEQLFTQCKRPRDRDLFITALHAAATTETGAPAALVVLVMRADFEPRFAEYPELAAAIQARELITGMNEDQLRDAIAEPARRFGVTVEDALLAKLTHEMRDRATTAPDETRTGAGALPLLSHALAQTWTKRTGDTLTLTGYNNTGGLAGALTTSAENAYTPLTDTQKTLTRQVFTRLVATSFDGTHTADRVTHTELAHARTPGQLADLEHILDTFATERLLTLTTDTVQLSHEVLLTSWHTLKGWLDEVTIDAGVRTRLRTTANEWNANDRDPSYLYTGTVLDTATTTTDRIAADPRQPPLGALEHTFLRACAEAARAQTQARQRRNRILVAITTVAVLAATAAGIGFLQASAAQREALASNNRDFARYLAATAEEIRDRQPEIAKQLSILAYQTDEKAGGGALSNSVLTPGLLNSGAPAFDVAYSYDGRMLAVSTGDGITLRDAREVVARLDDMSVGPIAATRDGNLLAAATFDQPAPSNLATIRLWNTTDLHRPTAVATLPTAAHVRSLTTSAEGQTLLAGTQTGEILRWDITDPAAPVTLSPLHAHTAAVDSLSSSPQRDLLAGLSVDGNLTVWNITNPNTPTVTATLRAAAYDPFDKSDNRWEITHRVDFDADGRYLVAPGDKPTRALGLWHSQDDGTFTKLDTEKLGEVCSSPEQASSAAFNRKTRAIVTLCAGSWRIWPFNKNTGAFLAGASEPDGFGAVLDHETAAMFDPRDEHQLMELSSTGIRLWNISHPIDPGAEAVMPASFRMGGGLSYRAHNSRSLLAAQTSAGNVLWDATDASNPTVLGIYRAPSMYEGSDIEISPDGRLIAFVELTENDGAELRIRSTEFLSGPWGVAAVDGGVQSLAFNPTRPLLAVSDFNMAVGGDVADRSVKIYDIADPRKPIDIIRIPSEASNLTFSPDGRYLSWVTFAWDLRVGNPPQRARVETWDLGNPAQPVQVAAHVLPFGLSGAAIAYHPEGRWLAAAVSGELWIWPINDGRPASNPLVIDIAAALSTDFAVSPDGTEIVLTVDQGGGSSARARIEIWNIDNLDEPYRRSFLGGRSNAFSTRDALAFSPDGKHIAMGSTTFGLSLWRADAAATVSSICASSGDPISIENWQRFLPGREYRPPCQGGSTK